MSKSTTTYEAIDGRIAPESITEDTMSGLKIVDGHAVKAPGDYEDPDRLYDMLIARIRKYHPSTDVSMVGKAYQMANVGRKLLDSFLSFQVPLFVTPFQRLENINFDDIKKSAIYKFVNDESHITTSGGIEPQLPQEAHQCMQDLLDMIRVAAPGHYNTLVGEIEGLPRE